MKFLLPPSRWISFPTSFAGSGKGPLLCWNVARQQCQPMGWPCLHTPLPWCSFSCCCLWGGSGCSLCLLPAALITVAPHPKSLSLTPNQTSRGQKKGKIINVFHLLTYSGFHEFVLRFSLLPHGKSSAVCLESSYSVQALQTVLVCPSVH